MFKVYSIKLECLAIKGYCFASDVKWGYLLLKKKKKLKWTSSKYDNSIIFVKSRTICFLYEWVYANLIG